MGYVPGCFSQNAICLRCECTCENGRVQYHPEPYHPLPDDLRDHRFCIPVYPEPVFPEILEKKASVRTRIILIIFFGLLSVYGTISGVTLYGAVLNVRDLGPFVAGLCCGPYVGIGAGIIGGIYRWTGGGPYMYTGLAAPILAGFLGSVVYLANKREIVSTRVAVVTVALVETLVSLMALIMATPASQFITIATVVAIPMIITNMVRCPDLLDHHPEPAQ